ncbi:MAG: glycosyltransferase family 4 protein [Erysipelothrix sp.]
MKVLFLSSTSSGVTSKGIYSDLMLYFAQQNHDVTIVYNSTKSEPLVDPAYLHENIRFVPSVSANLTKNKNLIKKGIATILFDTTFKNTMKRELKDEQFDLVLYATPPVNFVKSLKYLKKKNPNALFYLMLKDIFPQNAVDINIMRKNGLIYSYFKRQERHLYELSNVIGTMSPANYDYFNKNNPQYKGVVEILPNTTTLTSENTVTLTREELKLPEDMKLLFYGGNLGYPQSVPFILECFEKIKSRDDIGMVIVGSGGQDHLITEYIEMNKPQNFFYFKFQPHDKYLSIMRNCDIGLIFLDYRFTIPNYPQRVLGYMTEKLPVICVTDPSSDIGQIAEENKYGYFVPSNDSSAWIDCVDSLVDDENKMQEMGENAYQFLQNNYLSHHAYEIILDAYDTFDKKENS